MAAADRFVRECASAFRKLPPPEKLSIGEIEAMYVTLKGAQEIVSGWDEEPKIGPTNAWYREQAEEECSDGTLELDDDAVVSRGEEPGAYVATWLWVSAPTCDDCMDVVVADHGELCQGCAEIKAECDAEMGEAVAEKADPVDLALLNMRGWIERGEAPDLSGIRDTIEILERRTR